MPNVIYSFTGGNMKRLFLLIGLLFLISACASSQSYKKPRVKFSNFKKIAVVRFDCPNSGAGQEVADTISLEFIKHGFNVIERSQLRTVVNEEALVQSGLVEQTRDALKVSGINAIVVGSIGKGGRCVLGCITLDNSQEIR
jgi:hypothetical protein